MAKCRTDTRSILRAIQAISKTKETFYGNCGSFAIALNRILDRKGSFIVGTTDYEEDAFYHVALKRGKQIFDGDGLTTKDSVLAYARDDNTHEGDDAPTPIVVEIAWDSPELEENVILKRTEPSIDPEEFEALFRKHLCK